MGQRHAKRDAETFGNPVPPVHARLDVAREVVAQARIKGGERRNLPVQESAFGDLRDVVDIVSQRMVAADGALAEAAFQPFRVVARSVGGNFGAFAESKPDNGKIMRCGLGGQLDSAGKHAL